MKASDLPLPLAQTIRGYVTAIEILLVAGMAGMVILATLQVFFRYIVGASLSWSEEALRYLMIWIAFLGIGLAYSRGEMIGMKLLTNSLPHRISMIMGLIGRLMILAMMITIAWFGWEFAWKTRESAATALPVSMFWIHIAVATGAALTVLHVIASFVATTLGIEEQHTPLAEVVQ